ncbi:response regulator [Roseovarius sp.]|uniref:response regulator n=1 Tax=Roseovarius sp. TaxID=1486281 RepID=UPI0025DE24FA|nr:response regulator [Roseovarius sp.]
MRSTSVLVVDDDSKMRKLLRNCLEGDGFKVFEAASAAGVFDVLGQNDIALVTLDLQMAPDDGFDIARRIRQNSAVPIIMVTGRDDVIDRVVGLEIGADDYITKPFHIREVLARVRSVLRRSVGTGVKACGCSGPCNCEEDSRAKREPIYVFDNLVVRPDRLQLVDRSGNDCPLTSGDFRLLQVFLDCPKRPLSRNQLMDMTGGTEWNPLDRTIDNQVARLRKKIERDPANPKLIKSVRGVGYMFASDVKKTNAQDSSASSAANLDTRSA